MSRREASVAVLGWKSTEGIWSTRAGSRRARSRTLTQHPHDSLVLFDVPAVLVVVSWDGYRTDVRALHFPETRAGHRRSCNLRSRGAQFTEPDLHFRQDT